MDLSSFHLLKDFYVNVAHLSLIRLKYKHQCQNFLKEKKQTPLLVCYSSICKGEQWFEEFLHSSTFYSYAKVRYKFFT